jgi:hypothetical protein
MGGGRKKIVKSKRKEEGNDVEECGEKEEV